MSSRAGWLVLACLPSAALAQAWQLQGQLQSKLEHNDNPALSAAAPDKGLTTGSLAGGLTASRSSESSEQRADAELSLQPRRPEGGVQALGRAALQLGHSLPRGRLSANLAFSRDETLDSRSSAADLLLGAATRNRSDASFGAEASLSPRLQFSSGLSHGRTRFGGSPLAGQGFEQNGLSAGLNWRWSETQGLGLSASRTETRPVGGLQRGRIEGLRLSWNAALDERTSLSASLGSYLNQRRVTLQRLACPLQVQLCQAGFVPWLLVREELQRSSRELQYSAAFSRSLDESTRLDAGASRSLTPGALGVTRDDAWSLKLERAFSEHWSAGLALNQSRSAPAGEAGSGARLRTLTFSFSHRLADKLSLLGEAQRRRFDAGPPGTAGARSDQFSISLQYQGVMLMR